MIWTVDTNLKSVSPVTPKFLDDFLRAHKSPLDGIGCTCKMAESKYGINAVYQVAHAIHETGWGQSRICRDKNNLFGWTAYDDTPYASAGAYPSMVACVIIVMGKIDKLYLTPGGKHYNGATLRGMNRKYATDPNWAPCIVAVCNMIEAAWERAVLR